MDSESEGAEWSDSRLAEHQALTVILLAKKTVVAAITMLGIPDNRVKDVCHMATKLMFMAGMASDEPDYSGWLGVWRRPHRVTRPSVIAATGSAPPGQVYPLWQIYRRSCRVLP